MTDYIGLCSLSNQKQDWKMGIVCFFLKNVPVIHIVWNIIPSFEKKMITLFNIFITLCTYNYFKNLNIFSFFAFLKVNNYTMDQNSIE